MSKCVPDISNRHLHLLPQYSIYVIVVRTLLCPWNALHADHDKKIVHIPKSIIRNIFFWLRTEWAKIASSMVCHLLIFKYLAHQEGAFSVVLAFRYFRRGTNTVETTTEYSWRSARPMHNNNTKFEPLNQIFRSDKTHAWSPRVFYTNKIFLSYLIIWIDCLFLVFCCCDLAVLVFFFMLVRWDGLGRLSMGPSSVNLNMNIIHQK